MLIHSNVKAPVRLLQNYLQPASFGVVIFGIFLKNFTVTVYMKNFYCKLISCLDYFVLFAL